MKHEKMEEATFLLGAQVGEAIDKFFNQNPEHMPMFGAIITIVMGRAIASAISAVFQDKNAIKELVECHSRAVLAQVNDILKQNKE